MLTRPGRFPVAPGRGGPGPDRVAEFPWWAHLIEMAIVGLVVILVVLLVVWATRSWGRRPSPVAIAPTAALAELDLRYARGEVSHEEYLQRRANLLGQPAPARAPSTATTPTTTPEEP
jgi:uncharacterized membrane protein